MSQSSERVLEDVASFRSSPNRPTGVLTSFPFQLNYEGSLKLDSYVKTEDNGAGVVSATFRGRPIHAENVPTPTGYTMALGKSVERPDGQKMINLTTNVENVLSFEYDRQPGPHCRLQRQLRRINDNDWMLPGSRVPLLNDFTPEECGTLLRGICKQGLGDAAKDLTADSLRALAAKENDCLTVTDVE